MVLLIFRPDFWIFSMPLQYCKYPKNGTKWQMQDSASWPRWPDFETRHFAGFRKLDHLIHLYFAQRNRGVMSAKTKGVGYRRVDDPFLRNIWCNVQIALRIGCLVVYGRRHNIVFHGSAVAINSTAPAAPSKCPIIDFVELTFSLYA